MSDSNRLISRSKAAEILGISKDTLRRWIKEGILKLKVINNREYVDLDTVNALLDSAKEIEEARQKGEELLRKERAYDQELIILLEDYRRMLNLGKHSSSIVTSSLRDLFKYFVRYAMRDVSYPPKVEQVVNGFVEGTDPRFIAFDTGYTKPYVGVLLWKVARTIIRNNSTKDYRQAYLDLKASYSRLEEEYQRLVDKYNRDIKIQQEMGKEGITPFTEKEINLYDFLVTPWRHCNVSKRLFNAVNRILEKDNICAFDVAQLNPWQLKKEKRLNYRQTLELIDFFDEQRIELPIDADSIRKRYVAYYKLKSANDLVYPPAESHAEQQAAE